MQRALRGVIIERIEASMLRDRVWIEKDLASKIRHRIIGAVDAPKVCDLTLWRARTGAPSD